MKSVPTILLTLLTILFPACNGVTEDTPKDSGETGDTSVVLFAEPFEDTDWAARGWYDGPRFELEDGGRNAASTKSCVWHWRKAGDVTPSGGGSRAHLTPVDRVTLSYWIKHDANWTWTGVAWHPHEFHFITTEDAATVGPAWTHLTFYVEAVNGIPRVSIQDGRNIDPENIDKDLVGVTENRSVAGGNGDSDGYGDGDRYQSGGNWVNGKTWTADEAYFTDTPGPRWKGDWHHAEATFVLNTIKDGIGQKDGVIRFKFDGETLMDYDDVVFRTGAHPDMLINQFLMLPYFGPGVPHEQKIWVDDVTVTTTDPRAK